MAGGYWGRQPCLNSSWLEALRLVGCQIQTLVLQSKSCKRALTGTRESWQHRTALCTQPCVYRPHQLLFASDVTMAKSVSGSDTWNSLDNSAEHSVSNKVHFSARFFTAPCEAISWKTGHTADTFTSPFPYKETSFTTSYLTKDCQPSKKQKILPSSSKAAASTKRERV